MFKRKILPVFFAAAVFFAVPGTQKAHACPDANGILTHCANFQVIAGIVNFITANIYQPPGGVGFGGYDRTNAARNLLQQLALFNALYLTTLMNAILTPLPTTSGGTGGNDLDLSNDNIQDGAFGRPLCGATGECGAGPLGELFGGGPNSGYSCDSGGPGCGADFYNPTIGDDLRKSGLNFGTSTQAALNYVDALSFAQRTGGANPSIIDSIDFSNFVSSHPYQNNLTSGAIDPFGGGSTGVFIDPRTGDVKLFDPDNPPKYVTKARELNSAYVSGEINYPFFDDWENRPISDYDPNQGNRGGVERPESIATQLDNRPLFPGATTGGTDGSAHSTTESGTRPPRENTLLDQVFRGQSNIGEVDADFFNSLKIDFGRPDTAPNPSRSPVIAPVGTQEGQSRAGTGTGNQESPRLVVTRRPVALPENTGQQANAIRQRSVLVASQKILFSGAVYEIEIVQDSDGNLMALGTGENSGHVFGEIRKTSNPFAGGYRREGPWQEPPAATTSAQQTTSGGSSSSGAQGSAGSGNADCGANCEIQVPATRYEPGRFHIVINSEIANSDRIDMSNYFTDGFESGNTMAWTASNPP